MEASTIKKICLEIRESRLPAPKKKLVYRDKYPQFAEDYPKLFEACMDPTFPLMDHLDYMLQMMTSVNSEQLSVDAADKVVYGKLKDQYITPVIGDIQDPEEENSDGITTTVV